MGTATHRPPADPTDTRDTPSDCQTFHPAGKARYGVVKQVWRILAANIYFLVCVLVILGNQFIGCPLYLIHKPTYYAYMSWTKRQFGTVIITVTEWWSPTNIRVTGDSDVRPDIRTTSDGRLECHFPDRLVLIANHQLYSDWLYLWWISYTANMHGHLHIILKESLKYIPLLGAGMQFFSFIFLARKWEQDKPRFQSRLSKLARFSSHNPMWLMIFPEGTNLSNNGRNTSSKYAAKIGIDDLRHQLLPRSTGLRFCLQQLQGSVDWVYDCTVAYEGIPRGKYGQDYFTLYSTFIQGRPPRSVNMYWRRFAIKDIPLEDAAQFDIWLREVWLKKDELLEYYMQHGVFPDEASSSAGGSVESKENGPPGNGLTKATRAGAVVTEVKLASSWEIVDIFSIFILLCSVSVAIFLRKS